jgi:hypothetical protein
VIPDGRIELPGWDEHRVPARPAPNGIKLGQGTYRDVMQNVRVPRDAPREHGFVGVHVTPAPWGMPPNHERFYPVYAACVDLGLALFVFDEPLLRDFLDDNARRLFWSDAPA